MSRSAAVLSSSPPPSSIAGKRSASPAMGSSPSSASSGGKARSWSISSSSWSRGAGLGHPPSYSSEAARGPRLGERPCGAGLPGYNPGPLPPTLAEASAALRDALAGAARGLVEREALVELCALAAVAGEHLLVIGPPGTAKSEAVRRVARALGGQVFEYLLGRFTEPSEIFGPIDLRRLKEGVGETQTAGMLPEADVAFLDEVFLGSTAILNTLLGVLNERTFRRGATRMRVPLRVCVGASNALPDDEALAAFGDRFLIRAFLDPIADPRLEELPEGGWSLGIERLPHRARPWSTSTSSRRPSPPATWRPCARTWRTPSACCARTGSPSPIAGRSRRSGWSPPPR